MKARLVRLDAVGAQPWRNGSGVTRELLAWPSAQHWSIRVSVADIDADGAFSRFADTQRWFAVIDGDGVELTIDGDRRCVRRGDAPLVFSGEAMTDCRLLDGPTRDLNLMCRRGGGHATMRRAEAGAVFAPRHGWRALFVAGAATLQIDGADALQLPPFALAWSDNARGAWRLDAAAATPRAWWIGFDAEGPA